MTVPALEAMQGTLICQGSSFVFHPENDSDTIPLLISQNGFKDNNTLVEDDIADSEKALKVARKVQWNDSHGKELVQIFEFEPSDASDDYDDSEDDDSVQSVICSCVIQ